MSSFTGVILGRQTTTEIILFQKIQIIDLAFYNYYF